VAFLTGFFLVTTFFFDNDFRLLTFRTLAGDFFRRADLAGAALFLLARALVRFLVAVFLAVIVKLLPNRKARDYTPVVSTWKGKYAGLSPLLFAAAERCVKSDSWQIRMPRRMPE
jgi:hypothetical protein